jgi:tetratricopeptide (TPR) repeat protein
MARRGERGDQHPSAAELDRFLLGEMSPRQAAPVISHLLTGCPHCRKAMAPLASLVFASGPVAPEKAASSGAEYDFPMFKAFAAARQYAVANGGRREEPQVSAPQLSPVPLEAPRPISQSKTARDRCEALLERCWNLRYSDPEGMVLSAALAVGLVQQLIAEQGESKDLIDLEARAWAELGNSHRVADDLSEAEAALSRALVRSGQGSENPLLLARIMDLTASLYIDQRRFQEARQLLDSVYAIYRHTGDTQAAARTFISKGLASNRAFDPEEAIGFLAEGIRQIDPQHDPKLVLAAVHDLLWSLVDAGHDAQANGLLTEVRPLYRMHGERFYHLPQLWLEGRIASHLGQDEKAEDLFLRVREEYRNSDIAYDVALVSLDLATLWLRQERTTEIKGLLDETIAILKARNLQREALGALLMLRKAFETDQANAALLQTAATELWRLERSPVRRGRTSS